MKNLKKVLSLVLALAMALSLMTAAFAADASDFNDYDEVTYTEAVDVMVAAGVFNGADGNNFAPNATLTREQAAKIITYMLVGQEKADKMTATVAPYADVAANRWSAGAIAYCTNAGILAGIGGGKFAPTAQLTGLEFAKMLLVALGYDAKIEKLEGPAWAINTATLALSDDVDLDNGMEDVSLSAPLTREQAAQMAFNTFKATMVEYETKGDNITIGDVTINTGASKATPLTSKVKADATNISDDTVYMNGANVYTVEFAEKYCKDLKLKGDENDLKQPTNKWTYKNKSIGTYAVEPDRTIVVADKDKTLKDILIGSSYMDYSESDIYAAVAGTVPEHKANAYVNGNIATESNASLAAYAAIGLTKGDVVYAYENNAGKVKTVAVARYTYAQIDNVSNSMSTTEKNNGAAYRLKLIDIDENAIGTYYDSYDDSAKNELPGFNAASYKEDVVLAVAMNGKKIVDSYVAEVVSGKISSVKEGANGNIAIEGTKYNFAGTPAGTSTNFDFDKTYNVYTTKDGYVIAINGTGATSLDDIYYVTSIYNDNVAGETVYYAQRVSSTGKVDTVKVEKGALQIIKNAEALDTYTGSATIIADGTNAAGLYTFSDKKVDSQTINTSEHSDKQKSGDGVYTIKPFANSDVADDFATVGKSTLANALKVDDSIIKTQNSGNNKNYYVNKDTVYLAVEDLGSKITVTYAVGGMKQTETNNVDTYVVTDKNDTKTARLVIFAGNNLNASVTTEKVVYLASEAKQKASSETFSTNDLWFMDGMTNPAGAIITDHNTDAGFYTYSEKDGTYKLEDGTGLNLTAAYEDEDGFMAGQVVTGVYNKNGKSYVTFANANNYLDDIKFNGVTIIDNRGDDAADDVYATEITTIAELKDAVERAGVVYVDVYFDKGVKFIAVNAVGALAAEYAVDGNNKLATTYTNATNKNSTGTVKLTGTVPTKALLDMIGDAYTVEYDSSKVTTATSGNITTGKNIVVKNAKGDTVATFTTN